MIANVREDHIALGCIGDENNCPVARAVAEASGCLYAFVDNDIIAVSNSPLVTGHGPVTVTEAKELAVKWWETPGKVVRAIEHYDATGVMRSFSFEL
jgi:hypothetical protein